MATPLSASPAMKKKPFAEWKHPRFNVAFAKIENVPACKVDFTDRRLWDCWAARSLCSDENLYQKYVEIPGEPSIRDINSPKPVEQKKKYVKPEQDNCRPTRKTGGGKAYKPSESDDDDESSSLLRTFDGKGRPGMRIDRDFSMRAVIWSRTMELSPTIEVNYLTIGFSNKNMKIYHYDSKK